MQPKFVHTVWTVKLIRCVGSFILLFALAPLISYAYKSPVLTSAIRALSFWFLLSGAETMAFVIAQRERRARISNYSELASSAISTAFVIAAAATLHNQYALIYGTLFGRGILVVLSYCFYRDIGVRIAFDREALEAQFRFGRFVLPSSLLTIVLTQYDKWALLTFFDFVLVGTYGLALNMVGPVSGVIIHNARVVLYARCAEYFRQDRESVRTRYYAENEKLQLLGILTPAILAGFAQLAVAGLYDVRYAMAGIVLMTLALGQIIAAFQNASEVLLVASGQTQTVLVGNIIRLLSVPIAISGYYAFGFYGFLWFNLLSMTPVLGYFFWRQHQIGLLDAKVELKRFALALIVFIGCFVANHIALSLIPARWLHLGFGRSHH